MQLTRPHSFASARLWEPCSQCGATFGTTLQRWLNGGPPHCAGGSSSFVRAPVLPPGSAPAELGHAVKLDKFALAAELAAAAAQPAPAWEPPPPPPSPMLEAVAVAAAADLVAAPPTPVFEPAQAEFESEAT